VEIFSLVTVATIAGFMTIFQARANVPLGREDQDWARTLTLTEVDGVAQRGHGRAVGLFVSTLVVVGRSDARSAAAPRQVASISRPTALP
jgi:hypothetical protein